MTQFTKNRKGADSPVQSLVNILCNESFKSNNNNLLLDAVVNSSGRRNASFHMPGHKNKLDFYSREQESFSAYDLDTTELSGLDDLTFPQGPIKAIELRLAQAYGALHSILSLGGASHGLVASILAVAKPDHYLLVPRSAHRSIVNGVVLAGIDIVWYDPVWEPDWQFFGQAQVSEIESMLEKNSNCCGVLVVSPTFAGALSDIEKISSVCKEYKVPLIVDEAHGAHFLPGSDLPTSALSQGADVVVHSLHKTLTGLTQLGAVHIAKKSKVSENSIRASLRLVTTSSPSYPLMISAEQVSLLINSCEFIEHLNNVAKLCSETREELVTLDGLEIFNSNCGVDPFHISLRVMGFTGVELLNYFDSKGVFAESNLGNGCLLLAGSGSIKEDFCELINAVKELDSRGAETLKDEIKPVYLRQVINPKEAYFAPFDLVKPSEAKGRIACECIAPCPPGTPVISPGAIVPDEIDMFDSMLGKVRVIKE